MAKMKKCACCLRRIFGWLLIVLGGLLGASSAVCALIALFGGMELDSFGERMRFFATALMMTAAFFTILWLGIRLKNSGRGEKTAPPVKRKSSPANQKETQQATDEQRLQREKEEILQEKRTAYADKITVQDALNTFSEEEQQRFENRLYQYTQDTGRAGLSPEMAAANRGLVFVDGRPVAKEVATRLDEMRNCAAVLLTLETGWGGRAEHGEQKLTLTHQDDIYCLNLTSREWNDAGGCSTLQENSTKCVGELKAAERHRWTVSGFLFHAKTLRGLPVWAAEKLAQEKVFTELFTPPCGNCEEEAGQVYWSNWRDLMEYRCIWFEKQDGMWHAHSDVRMGGIRIKKDTPLPDATDKNIARCLELDSMIYLYHPDIENWIRRDRCGEVTLYHQIEEKGSTDEHHIIYTIDPRNGALYYYEGFPWDRAAPEEAHPATYAELAQTDSRYTGMTIQNWEKYLPKKVNSDQNGRQSQRLSKSMDLPKKMADNLGEITVQDALNTFSEEEQQWFENRRYQYTQDTGRAGLSPEIAAANRGMVFVDGRPVAKEVAARLDEMRNAVSSDNAAMISEKKFVPIFIPNLAGYQMKMHTDSGEEHCFTLTGLKAYYPNMSSMCGYGSDEWCFHCKYNGENYILRFCDDSGYGTIWDCALINKENAEQLEKLSVVEWLKLVLKSETKIFHLHPDTIDAAKNIVQATSSRCGPISDNGFYGR